MATGFNPPSSQDKIFGNNFGHKPERDLGWDIGVRQELWQNRVGVGLTYFHNDLSNAIGSNGLFQTLTSEPQRRKGSKRSCARNRLPISCSRPATHIWKQKTLPRKILRNCKARVCLGGRATNFTLQFRIFGGKNCAQWSKQSS